MRILVFALALSFLTGCLKTRNEVKDNQQRQSMAQQVTVLQKTNADATSRVMEMEDLVRQLNGRIEVVEHKMGQGNSNVETALKNSQSQNMELNQKVTLLQDALTKMETQVLQLTAEIQALKAEKTASAARETAEKAKKDAYETAQVFFDKKDWKQAILNYQKYRDDQPKGKNFADATYRMGVSFQELGMKDEARTFYDEVVNKFPKSDAARRAKIRLKSMKK